MSGLERLSLLLIGMAVLLLSMDSFHTAKEIDKLKQTISASSQFPVGKLQNNLINSFKTSSESHYSVVEFGASWCGACKAQAPITSQLRSKGIPVTFIDADSYGKSYKGYSVYALPTIFIEKDGKIIKKFVGLTSLSELEGAMN